MMCDYEFSPYRQYVQFNDLIFESEEMLQKAETSISTKVNTTSLSYIHGDYVPFKSESMLLEAQDVSMTLKFDYRLYRREDRRYIGRWASMNLLKQGKLWSIKDGRLMWAYAYVDSMSESYEKYVNSFSIDVSFKLYEGIWHFADPLTTFIIPYDTCNIMDCLDFDDDYDSCVSCCVDCLKGNDDTCSCACDCDLKEDYSLCSWDKNKLFHGFLNCGHSFKIVIDCVKGNELYGDKTKGIKLCKEDYCDSMIAKIITSRTVLPTTSLEVIVSGKWQDPIIDINGNKMQIHGDYDGILRIDKSGEVHYSCSECSEEEDIPIGNIKADSLGFVINNGQNRIVISGSCCKMGCAWIKVDEISN